MFGVSGVSGISVIFVDKLPSHMFPTYTTTRGEIVNECGQMKMASDIGCVYYVLDQKVMTYCVSIWFGENM